MKATEEADFSEASSRPSDFFGGHTYVRTDRKIEERTLSNK
jgi:hypothetical protein